MNTELYRLVFNVARGMLVAVQECAKGRGKGSHTGTRASSGSGVFVPVFWFTALSAATMGLPLAHHAQAQTLPIQVDRGATGAQPYVSTAANGTPVVNIAPPNRPGGTSVNNFIQYNVGPSGVVVNNSGQNSQTQIAGWVHGNMQLGNNHAGTIVQQVTAPNPSQLLGMQEIAGNSAALVLVNPAGIYCSACGTIGADRFTLSTGRALYGPDGSLAGFDVSQGNLAIGAQGLSSPQAQVDLLARSIQVNGEVWSKYLNAIAGANQIDAETLAATPQAGAGRAPQFAIDASALGSMYAGAVRLVGTEKGIGFNIGNNIVASTGDIVLDVNGDVRILPSARLQAQGAATVSGTNLDNAGTVTTRGRITATTPGTLSNSGVLSAGGDVLAQTSQLANSGTIGAGTDANGNVTQAGTANIAASAAIQSSGSILAAGDANLSAPRLNLNGGTLIAHNTANVSATGDISHQGARLEGNAVQIAAGGTFDNTAGSVVAGANGATVQAASILNRSGSLSSGGTLGVNAQQTLDNTAGTVAGTGAATLQAANTINRGGSLGSTQGAVQVTGALDNTGGKTLAAGDLSVSGGAITNDQGQMSGQNVRLDAGAQAFSNVHGTINGAGTTTVTAGSVQNQGGAVTSTGTLDVRTPGSIENAGGTLAANGATTLTAAKVNNQAGTIGSVSSSLTGNGPLDNTGGKALAGTDVAMSGGAITNDQGQIAGQSVTLDAAEQAVSNAQGSIAGGIGATTIVAASLQNQQGSITSGGTLAVQTPGVIENAGGTLGATGAATLSASQINNQAGTLGSVKDALTVNAPLDNTNGSATAGTNLTIQGGPIVNDHGQLSAGQTLKLDTEGQALVNTAGTMSAQDIQADTGTVNNQGGLVLAKGTLQANTHGQAYDNSQGGQTIAGGAMTLTTGALNNANGVVSGQQAVTVNGAAMANQQGQIIAGGPLAVTGDSLANAGGQVAANGDVTLRMANTLDNTAGFTHAGGALDVQAATILNANTLGGTDANPLGMEGSTVQLVASAIDNILGALLADTALTVTAATLNNTQGEVTSGGTAQLNVDATTNTQGLLAANQKLGVTGASLTGDGTVQSAQGDVALSLKSDFNNSGEVKAAINLALDTTGDVNNSGTMRAGNGLDVHGRNLNNTGELYGAVSNHLRADQSVNNSGLIDGGAVRIDAGTTVTNVDRIFGDTVSIGAGQQILNDVNPATGQGGVIASRVGDINLGAPDIINREHALIYASQDLNVGGALDANGKATGQANSLTNASATIDVARDANVNATSINNLNNHFETQVTDTGVVNTVTYRLRGSDQDIDPTTAIFWDWKRGSPDAAHPATDLGWLYQDANERGAYRWLILPSTQYPFSQFGPPFDWSRLPDGSTGPNRGYYDAVEGDNAFLPAEQWTPVGLALAQFSQTDNVGNVVAVTDEHFYYQPGDAIWDKLGVQRPSSAPPPFQAACASDAPASCQDAYQAYQTWRQANFAQYQALNDKIKAFNLDFHSRVVRDFYSVNEQTQTRDETVKTTDPARLLVGGNATLNGAVVNDKSQILVGGDLIVPAPVDNRGYTGTRIETVTGSQDWNYINYGVNDPDRRTTPGPLPPINVNLPLVLATGTSLANQGTIGHDGSAPGQGAGLGTMAGAQGAGTGLAPLATQPVLKELVLPTSGNGLAFNGPGARLGGATIRQVTPALAMPQNALFHVNTAPGAHYLIETDPRFTDQRQWLSSDFMLSQLGQDPNNVVKRLGDGFYEARLVADAVMLGTGQRFVGDYSDNEAQYIGLMKAGVTFAQQFHLTVGTELTPDQMAALTSDMVWLVEKTVTLPDGSTQKVLVPQVYLMSHVGELKADGTLISANNVGIQTTGDVNNTGTISGRKLAVIDAQNINNIGGTLNGGTLVLNAQQDINNLAGKITGGNVAAQAGRDINFTTTTTTATGVAGEAVHSRTVISGVSELNADNATLLAGRDLTATAASIATTGDLGLGAGRNVNLGTVEIAERRDSVADDKNRTSVARSTEIGTQIQAGGDATLLAGQDVNAKAAYVSAGGAIGVGAGHDINIRAGQASVSIRDEQSRTSGGFLSSQSTHTIDQKASTDAVGSTFSGNTVDMQAKHDLTLAGSTVAGTKDVNLSAGHNLEIGTTETQSSAYSFKEEKKSGFGATGNGISYGSRDQKDTTHDAGTQQVGSMVGSTDGSVHLNAGNTLSVKGSSLIAAQDITGKGADINIEAAQNAQHHDETHEVKQSGFTLGVGGTVGQVMSAAQKINNASKSQDGRASALWGIAAARDAYDGASAIGSMVGGSGGGSPASGQQPSATVQLSWGSSQSKQTLTQDSTSHNGSRVSAGGTASFQATGVDADGNKTAGNLNVIGSDINASKVALQAKHDVNIVSATDTDESHSTNKSSSVSVGVSVGTTGYGVSASGSMAKGNSDSTGTSQANSHVRGSESVTIVSENDTNILGGTVSGGHVAMDVGGNLNLASRQDTQQMHADQQSASGGVSFSTMGGFSGNASYMQGKANGSYANVGEQTGVYAGQGGFDINVKGNTDLKGAVIASDATKDRNNLSTGTLTYSDLQNHSGYSATSVGTSVGTSPSAMSPMIPQHKSQSENGVAQSAIADGAITIKDQAKQSQDVAGLKRDTTSTNSQVGNNPNLKNVLDSQADTMAAAQAAGAAVARTVGDIAQSKQDDAQKRMETAGQALKQDPSPENQAAFDAAKADYEGWNEGGQYRAGLQAAGGALIGGLGGGSALTAAGGAAGAGAASLAATKLEDVANNVSKAVGSDNPVLNQAIGNLVSSVAAGGLGALVGGVAGAATGANVDIYNRQLHPDEQTLANRLSAASGGKYTPQQVGDAMRAASNGKYKEDVTAGMVVDGVSNPNGVYDNGAMFTVPSQDGRTLVQTIPNSVDPNLAGYIQSMTGGKSSPYSWNDETLGKTAPTMASTPTNPFTPAPNGCITAECAAGLGQQGRGLIPDYATGGVSVLSGSASATVNLYDGTSYVAGGVTQNFPSVSWKPGVTGTVGWIFGANDAKAANSFLNGDGNQAFVSIPTPFKFNVVGAVTHAYGGSTAIEFGLGSPGTIGYGVTPWSHGVPVTNGGK
ncbi:hemagglutinin repeat-containing protein [Cupriavidus necator]|uniref:Filamentous hemagglutinin, N-terminal:Adhesin HecA 20-residue repeat x2 n=1 Tax=Cupriavidus pinatubonensis (strain JMP 134 / LMG 1197) TaxID=264198 RepID=Q477F8_CUPPJ|nr:hemagglutinin repeat-containing protein [Cupriavidus necator]